MKELTVTIEKESGRYWDNITVKGKDINGIARTFTKTRFHLEVTTMTEVIETIRFATKHYPTD